ncbi:MAG: lysophospholipid acyltransferase family protein [Methylotenera sp.]
MLSLLFKPLALLSLANIHRLGAILGYAMYLFMPQAKKRIRENLTQCKLFNDESTIKQISKLNVIENGKSIIESLAIWQKQDKETLAWVKPSKNYHLIEEAIAKQKGIIFLTPHMGCFEITSIFYGAQHPITVLFRRPKKRWLQLMTESGRAHNQVKLATANLQGVRLLMQALKRGEAIGILPDQVPARGEGELASFFGKPAYTMTLVSKLAEKTGATIIMAFGERLENAQGFEIHLTKLAEGAVATPTLLNQAIEQQIAQKPTQYLWSYPRYKVRNRIIKREKRLSEN